MKCGVGEETFLPEKKMEKLMVRKESVCEKSSLEEKSARTFFDWVSVKFKTFTIQ